VGETDVAVGGNGVDVGGGNDVIVGAEVGSTLPPQADINTPKIIAKIKIRLFIFSPLDYRTITSHILNRP
jgi:hypothetical protein